MQRITNTTNKNKILYPELSYEICGLCFGVHNELGRYLNERLYADALENLFKQNNVKYLRENALAIFFQGETERRNIPDFIVEDKIILDLKAKTIVAKEDYYQMKRYLAASGKRLGLIINFRQKYLSPKRILN